MATDFNDPDLVAARARRRAARREALSVRPGDAATQPPLEIEREAQARAAVERGQRESAGRTERAALHEQRIAERQARLAELRSPGRLAKDVAFGTALGAGTGALLGPAGAAAGALRGAAWGGGSALLGNRAAAATGDIGTGIAVETLADPGLAAAGGLFKGAKHFTSAGRAGRTLRKLGFPEDMGDEGAESVAHIAREGVGQMRMDKDLAYDMAKKLAPEASVSPELLVDIVGKRRYARMVAEYDDPSWKADDWVDWERLDHIRKQLGDAQHAARISGLDDQARRLGIKKDKLDTVYEHMADQSVGGTAGMDALQTARTRHAEYRSVLPKTRGHKPHETLLRDIAVDAPAHALGPPRPTPEEWFNTVMMNKKGGRPLAFDQGYEAARRIGQGKYYKQDFRTAYLTWVAMPHGRGATPSAVRGATTQASKVSATDDIAEKLFTPKQLSFLRENLEALAEAQGGADIIKRVRVAEGAGKEAVRWALLLGGGGYGVGGDIGIAAAGGAIGAGGYVIGKVSEKFGPQMARALAARAMYDKSLMAQLASPLEKGINVQKVVERAVRRFGLTAEDVSRMEEPSVAQ
jgi:hypothetical protein